MSICCSNPAADPNYTVCFPDTQIIPGGSTAANPFYDFTNQISYWTYSIQIDPAGSALKDLSHWVLQICPDRKLKVKSIKVEVSTDGGLNFFPVGNISLLSVDPPTGVINVLKIDRQQNKGTTNIYRITIDDPHFFNLAAEPGVVAIKAGPQTFLFNGNVCTVPLPTPSVNCRIIQKDLMLMKKCAVPPETYFMPGDSVSITLCVDNPNVDAVSGVTVVDKINIPSGVTIGSLTTDPAALVVPLQLTYSDEDILITWSGLTIPPGVTMLSVVFTVVGAPIESALITNVDAGIGSLSGTTGFQCFIPVIDYKGV